MIKKIIFGSIIFLAVFLRFFKLGLLPNSFTPDEVAQGYTAYSILKTGHDEWGSSNFLSFRSFGDFKPPIQTLLLIPSIKFFGLTIFAVRFPNALFSVFSVLLFYFISQKLFKKSNISLLGTFLLSVSPWFLPMSRIALEANLLLFFILLGLFCFFHFIDSRRQIFLIISAFSFSLSVLIYHSAKLFIPLFLILLFSFFWKSLKIKNILIFLSILGIFLCLNQYLNSQVKTKRTSDIAIFNPTDKWKSVSDNRYETTQNGLPSSVSRIFNNKLTYSLKLLTDNYLSYFSPQFLVSNGAGETTYGMIPGIGVLGLIETFGVIFSFYLLVISSKNKRNLFFIFLALALSPIAASLAKGSYSGNRASLMVPFLILVSSFGLVSFFETIKKHKFYKLILGIFVVFLFYGTFYFLQKYFFQGNQVLADGMLFGRKEAIEYLQSIPNKPERIIFSRKLSEPQAFVSFFNRIDPKNCQKESANWLEYESKGLSFLDQLGEYNLDNFVFREINIVSDMNLPNTLIIGKPEEFRDIKPDKIIMYPYHADEIPAIYIYQTKSEK